MTLRTGEWREKSGVGDACRDAQKAEATYGFCVFLLESRLGGEGLTSNDDPT